MVGKNNYPDYIIYDKDIVVSVNTGHKLTTEKLTSGTDAVKSAQELII